MINGAALLVITPFVVALAFAIDPAFSDPAGRSRGRRILIALSRFPKRIEPSLLPSSVPAATPSVPATPQQWTKGFADCRKFHVGFSETLSTGKRRYRP